MFCIKCGTKLSEEAVFCHNCGTKLNNTAIENDVKEKDDINHKNDLNPSEELKEITTKFEPITALITEPVKELAVEPITEPLQEPFKELLYNDDKFVKSNNRSRLWLPPTAAAVFSITLTLGCFVYEKKVSNDAENIRVEAETTALQGKISEAQKLVDKGLSLRPNNKTLQEDKKLLVEGDNIQKHIETLESHVKKQDYAKALEELDKADKEIGEKKGALYSLLKKNIEDKRTGITVLQIKSEMNNKKSIDELAPLLTKISNYTVKEATDTASELRKKIGVIAYNNANELLKKNDFTGAAASIEDGLKYTTDDKKLISFKDTIAKQKASFEKAEQQRIEQAMVAAAKEDTNNRTNAVKVLETNASVNQYGDFVISGKVKNIATRPISSIKIYYTVYDANNNTLGTDYTYVYPDYLDINAEAEFQNTEYGAINGHHIKINNITWYLN